MQPKLIIIASFSVIVTTLTGCATHYKTTLTDARGETVTCEANGKTNIVNGYYQQRLLRRGFEDCIADAKAHGFKEGSPERNNGN